ncbi:MAG TPA: type III-B CRISPR module RAMP protein Cmr6 [Pseudonocardiaceae bacterium]|nr:type III-B CRISPR module RAMP protein Cmr6 [Pseudonocardiaceae bacterium]
MTVHGVLRHVLEDEVARLTRRIEERLRSARRDPAAPLRFGDLGTINPGLLLHRLWLADTRDDVQTALHEAHLRAVTTACRKVPSDLLPAVHARRAAAAAALAARHPGLIWRSMLIEPMWRLVVGHGEDSVHETALTLSPTYGVPVLPGTALKGLAAAAAQLAGWSELDDTLFGTPRPGRPSTAHRGSVLIWDGVPTEPPELVLDVLTPHVKAYYDSANTTGTPAAEPAEYHNPVPVRFLAVEKTSFRAYVLGPPRDVGRCVELISSGLEELGIGGKTAAGYGYCVVPEEPT